MFGIIKHGLMVGSINGVVKSWSDNLSRLTDSPVLDPQTEVWLVYRHLSTY